MEHTSTQQWVCQVGNEVYGCDEHKLGKVKAVNPTHVVVEKGLLFSTDYFIPTSAINNCESGRVYLNVTKDEALSRGWDQPPSADSGGSADIAL